MGELHAYLVLVDEGIRDCSSNWRWNTLHGFVLEHGQEFEFEPYDAERWGPPGKMKECYENAYRLAAEHPDELAYCEGFAVGIIPVEHAWCVERATGKVVDPTWVRDGQGEYLGVPLQLSYVRKVILSRKRWGVIDNFEDRWPLLTGEPGHLPEDFKDEL